MPLIQRPELLGYTQLGQAYIQRDDAHRDCTAILRFIEAVGGDHCALCDGELGDLAIGIYVNQGYNEQDGKFRLCREVLCPWCGALPIEIIRGHLVQLAKAMIAEASDGVQELALVKDREDSSHLKDAGFVYYGLTNAADLLAACEGEIVRETPCLESAPKLAASAS